MHVANAPTKCTNQANPLTYLATHFRFNAMLLHGLKPRRSLGAVRYLEPPPFEALARNVHVYDGYGRILGG